MEPTSAKISLRTKFTAIVNILRGRSVMYGLKIHGGTIYTSDNLLIANCDITTIPPDRPVIVVGEPGGSP